MKSIDREDILENRDVTTMQLILLKVSEIKKDIDATNLSELKQKLSNDLKADEDKTTITASAELKSFIPTTFQVVEFSISTLLYQTLFSDG